MSENAKPARRTMKLDEAAVLLGISRNTVYDAARRGEIPVIRLGKRLLVPTAALERMLNGEAA